jgi:Citrate lyase beta subunit
MNRIDGRPRRSLLYIPGNNPGMIQNCAIYGSDGVLLDLEDSISVTEKDAARKLVKHALRTLNFGTVERVVRINGRDTPFFERDLGEIILARPDAVRIPKIDSPDDVRAADDIITRLEEENGMERGSVRIHAMLETARAIVNASAIASSSPRTPGAHHRRPGPGGRPRNQNNQGRPGDALRPERRCPGGEGLQAFSPSTLSTPTSTTWRDSANRPP